MSTSKLLASNNKTINLVECSFRYTKEDQFNRHKAYNLPDLLSILLDRSQFYADKCVDAGNNVLESWLRNCHSKYVRKLPNINPEEIVQLGPHSFLVPSESVSETSYLVDMEMRSCTCPQGQLRGPCKHKHIVSVSKMIPSFDVLPTSNPERRIFMYLGTGQTMDMNWFLPLQADTAPPDVSAVPAVQVHEQSTVSDHLVVDRDTVTPVSTEVVRLKLQSVMSALHDKLAARIEHDPAGYEKAIAALGKTVERLPSTVDSALQKSLHCFGKSVTEVRIF